MSSGWDFGVERVTLGACTVDAAQRLAVVVAQPYYEVAPEGQVRYRIKRSFREKQNELIARAFHIRALNAGRAPVPFIVFPEFAVPAHDPDGLKQVEDQLAQAQGDVIFIGGIEGLSPSEVSEILGKYPPGESGQPDFGLGSYVNLCVIAVRTQGGVIWHYQAKLAPSKWERSRDFARGSRVLYFGGPNVAFLCQTCFDHLATEGADSLNSALYAKLVSSPTPHAAARLDFVFVPQYNNQPNHRDMRAQTSFLLNRVDPGLQNNDLAVVFANRAAKDQDAVEFGHSGLHYQRGRWQPPHPDTGPDGYELYEPGDYNCQVVSAVFRKRSSAFHVATLVPPSFNTHLASDPRVPFENPGSYPIDDRCGDKCRCLPPGGERVVCKCLPCKLRDHLPQDSNSKYAETTPPSPHATVLTRSYREARAELLNMSPERSSELLDLYFRQHSGRKANPDTWKQDRADALKELADALGVLREAGTLDLESATGATAVHGSGLRIVVLECKGCYWQAAVDEYRAEQLDFDAKLSEAPILIVALGSMGRVTPDVRELDGTVDQVSEDDPLSEGPSPFEPTRPRAWVCRDDLFEDAAASPDIAAFLTQKLGAIGVGPTTS